MMKRILLYMLLIGAVTPQTICAQTHTFTFESYDSTPYFFRFGNKGNKGEYNYKPRWMYSHQVKNNEVSSIDNSSSKVLHYTSQEAKNYGLKFRLPTAVPIAELKEVRFRIYQPKNVIGKAFDAKYSTASATTQKITIKLLSAFNSVVDFTQDEGILMYQSAVNYTNEEKWETFSFTFDASIYSTQLNKFTNGVVGIAILPTYEANTTLSENDSYECYLDDIEINPLPLSIESTQNSVEKVMYHNGALSMTSSLDGTGRLTIYNASGHIIYTNTQYKWKSGLNHLALPLNKGVYIIDSEKNNLRETAKLIVCS